MDRPAIAIRPEPGLTATLRAGFARGMKLVGMPLSQVEPLAWRAPARAYDALLVGSANAIREAGAELDKLRHLPVLAVGDRTAEAARAAGLRVIRVGTGGLQGLLDAVAAEARLGEDTDLPTNAALLRLAGEARVALAVPAGLHVDEVALYRVVHRPLSRAQAERLAEGAVVLLHSAEAARHFAHSCDAAGVPRHRIALAGLAARIVAAAGPGWRAARAAIMPEDEALLAVAERLCQDAGGE